MDIVRQVEISELINKAVVNAVERRQNASDSENSLLDVSDEYAGKITGGQAPTEPLLTGYHAK